MDLLGVVAAVGGLALVGVLLFAIVANKRRSAASRKRTEVGTKELYERIDRQDQRTDPDKADY